MTERPDVAEDRAREWWYAACENCTAKWFAPFEPQRCPRCGHPVEYFERQTQPWLPSPDWPAGKPSREL